MINKELQELLKEFPEDMEVMLDRNGSIYTECGKPRKRYLNPVCKNCIILSSPIPLGRLNNHKA